MISVLWLVTVVIGSMVCFGHGALGDFSCYVLLVHVGPLFDYVSSAAIFVFLFFLAF